jgi:cell division protein FtsB
MTDPTVVEKIEKLSATVARLEARIEDLEDLRDLEQAIAENAGKPLIPWEQVKDEIECD